jgi:diaminopimelate decarboxylase
MPHAQDCLEMPYKPVIGRVFRGCCGEAYLPQGGNSCLSGDFMGDWSFDEPLKVGDRIVFEDMIHYTIVKTTNVQWGFRLLLSVSGRKTTNLCFTAIRVRRI